MLCDVVSLKDDGTDDHDRSVISFNRAVVHGLIIDREQAK